MVILFEAGLGYIVTWFFVPPVNWLMPATLLLLVLLCDFTFAASTLLLPASLSAVGVQENPKASIR